MGTALSMGQEMGHFLRRFFGMLTGRITGHSNAMSNELASSYYIIEQSTRAAAIATLTFHNSVSTQHMIETPQQA